MTDVATIVAAEHGNGLTETPAERNKRLVKTFQTEVLHLGHYDHARAWAHEDLIIHLPPGIPRGLDSALQWFALCADWFTSLGIEINLMIAEGDTVFQHIRLHFRHTGTYLGVPPTGKEFAIDGLAAFKLRDGKIAEHWGLYDMERIPAQLGLDVPAWPGA